MSFACIWTLENVQLAVWMRFMSQRGRRWSPMMMEYIERFTQRDMCTDLTAGRRLGMAI